MLASGTTNVIFSLLVGAILVVLGSYGRFTDPSDRHETAAETGGDPRP